MNSRLGRAENEHFLEQFRYTIIASQLLNEHANPTYYNPSPADTTQQPNSSSGSSTGPPSIHVSFQGTIITAIGAFAFVWVLHWARGGSSSQWNKRRILLVLTLVATTATLLYTYARRRWLQSLRHQAVHRATLLVSNAQMFDASAFAAASLIQEVELVSRGYRM